MIWYRDPKHRIHRADPILPPNGAEVAARKRLMDLAQLVQNDTAYIVDWLKAGGIRPTIIANALEEQLQKWEYISVSNFAAGWVMNVDKVVKAQLTDRVQTALRGRAVHILDDDRILEAANTTAQAVAEKIKDVPRAYIDNVAKAAMQNFSNIPFPEGRSLTQQLMHINNENFERAKFIANQTTGAITTQINKARQTAMGIEEYYWSSSHDERTVGNPAGKYPTVTKKQESAHGNHWARDYRNNGGKAYRWDEPFEDGLPREAFHCRCTALARIDTAKLKQDKVILLDDAAVNYGLRRRITVTPTLADVLAA